MILSGFLFSVPEEDALPWHNRAAMFILSPRKVLE